MANTVFKLRRSSVAGKVPTTSDIAIGELALNLTDRRLYSSDGSNTWEIGANNTNVNVSNTLSVANTVFSNNSGVHFKNNIKLNFSTLNGNVVSFIQQSDDNFVFYTTNTAGGSRAVWSIFANSITSNLNFSVPVNFSANVGALTANGTTGTAGQALLSNGSSTYWSTLAALVTNTAAQYVWTNTHTFSANVSFSDEIGLATNNSLYFNGVADANWRIGRNTNNVTKWVYTGNTIDILTANTSGEGFAIGLNGQSSYFETGYLGTYVANRLVVGSSTSNATINSSAIIANSITISSPNTATFTNINGQTNASAGDFKSNAYAYLGGFGGNYLAFGQQSNFHQWIQSGYSASGAVYYSIILNPLGGNIGIGNTDPTDKLSVNGTTFLGGDVTLGSSGLSANGSYGSFGQSLLSNGSSTYWATAGATLNANNTDTQTYYIGLANGSSGAWTNAVVSTTKLYYVPSTGKLDASIVNASSFTVGTAFTANATVVNAVSYYAGSTLIGNTTGPYGKTEINLNVNNSITSNTASYLGNSSGTTANFVSWITGNSATAYTNAVSYTDGKILTANAAITGNAATAYTNSVSYTDSKIATANSAITGNAATAYTNAVSYVDGLKLDSVTNTSITFIPVANTVKNAYDRAIDANTRAASAQTAAAAAYTNAVSYTDGKILTANSAITGNAATAYTNAVSYTNGLRLDSVTNTSILFIPVANTVKNAYDRAIDANTRAASAQSAAISAYSNAVSYTDGKILTANAAITGNAATAYTNAVSYVDGKILTANAAITGNAATAYTNSVSYTDGKILTANAAITGNAATAYTNAVSYVDGKILTANAAITGNAATAYSNATVFASNATNINTGTLAEARLPYRMDQNVRTTDSPTFSTLTLTGSLNISGNVNVVGANTLSVVDNFIYLNSNNSIDNEDTGIVANYNSTGNSLGYAHTGIFRDASDGTWKVFDGYKPEPDANVNIDTTNTTFQIANFQANTLYLGNTSTNWLVSNTSGVYHTGTVNAASHTVGTSTIANSSGLYTGVVNGSSITVGSSFVANSTTTKTPVLFLDRSAAAARGINWYNSGYTAWQDYMAPAGASQGWTGTVTAPSGTYVTSWARRSFIENNALYGWTWESGTATSTTPSVVAELASATGNFRTIGSIYSGSTLIGNTTGPYGKTEATLNVNSAVTVTTNTSSNTFTIGTGTYFVSNGNVGIGNSSPVHKLSVNGTGYFGGTVNATGAISTSGAAMNITGGANPYLYLTDGTYGGYLQIASSLLNLYHANAISFSPGASTSTYLASNGNVGVGNTTPADKLVVAGNIMPSGDNSYNLGSASLRWANVYTGDLHLSNERTRGNDIDGTTGNWTIQEGESELYIINNKNGKKFKFKLEEMQ